jgi:hypothetical protein
MKKPTLCLVLILGFTFSAPLFAQDTLPRFSVRNVGNNRIIVGWVNSFETVKQISIQRSHDSLKNYSTILTVPDPTTKQNGFVDLKAPNDHMFYRLYILLDKGVYLFSDPKKPAIDSLTRTNYTNRTDRLGGIDSVSVPNHGINGKNLPNAFRPSMHVYTHRDGYVRVNLPDDPEKKYDIKFYEENDSFLFELKNIKERTFKIDKSNFYHAGWFKFELFENGKLIEKHKFFLQREF